MLFFGRFSIYLAASAAKYCEKGFGRYKNWRGVIDKPILELLTFGSNPDFKILACFAHVLRVLRMFSGFFGPKGGCASSRLDHGLKTHPGRLR